jgi:hypothetical protein
MSTENINRWFFPSFGGDFEVVAEGTDKSKLLVKDPSPAELSMLGKALKTARRRGWISEISGIAETGVSTLILDAPLREVCRVIAKEVVPRQGALTALRSADGKVTAVLGIELPTADSPQPTSDSPQPTSDSPQPTADSPQLPAKVKDKDAKAVTVKKPTHCCPYNQPGPMERADRVLRCFCTPDQIEEWEHEGRMTVLGHLSGHLYQVCHRHHPDAVRRGKIVFDLDDGDVLHLWDWTVPPPEEVLAMKLYLEHAEPAVRNYSSCLYSSNIRFENPFPGVSQGLDGIDSASALLMIGSSIQNFVQGLLVGAAVAARTAESKQLTVGRRPPTADRQPLGSRPQTADRRPPSTAAPSARKRDGEVS